MNKLMENTKSIDDIVKKLIKTLGITNTSSSSSSSSSSSKISLDKELGLESHAYDEIISSIQYLFEAIKELRLESIYDISPILSGAGYYYHHYY